MASEQMIIPGRYVQPQANDRLKATFNSWFWGSLLAAAVIHFVVLAYFPEMTTADVSIDGREMEQVNVQQDEYEIPPPPEQIARPAVPVLSADINLSEDITIGAVTFESNPISNLPPPPPAAGTGVNIAAEPVFTPFEIRPQLRNRSEFINALERRYPPMLKDAGIGGTVDLWVFINERGAVQNVRVNSSSGYPDLDRVGEALMREVAQFSPAQNRDQAVPVWVSLPVTFQTAN